MHSIILHRLERVESSDDLIYTGVIQLNVKNILWSEQLFGFCINDLKLDSSVDQVIKNALYSINNDNFFTIIHYAHDKDFIVVESIDNISATINGICK